jgi:hypothetical protein
MQGATDQLPSVHCLSCSIKLASPLVLWSAPPYKVSAIQREEMFSLDGCFYKNEHHQDSHYAISHFHFSLCTLLDRAKSSTTRKNLYCMTLLFAMERGSPSDYDNKWNQAPERKLLLAVDWVNQYDYENEFSALVYV